MVQRMVKIYKNKMAWDIELNDKPTYFGNGTKQMNVLSANSKWLFPVNYFWGSKEACVHG